MSKKNFKAYTLLELLVAMGVFTFLSLVLIPFTVNTLKSNSSRSVATDLSSILYSYQQEAYAGKDNKSYGFALNTNNYVLFVGTSLAAAESSDTTSLLPGVTISSMSLSGGGNQIVFSPGSVKPSKSGTIRITDEFVSYDVVINQEGFINVVKV